VVKSQPALTWLEGHFRAPSGLLFEFCTTSRLFCTFRAKVRLEKAKRRRRLRSAAHSHRAFYGVRGAQRSDASAFGFKSERTTPGAIIAMTRRNSRSYRRCRNPSRYLIGSNSWF